MTIFNSVASLARRADEVAVDLAAYLRALPPAALNGPSDCAGWSIGAVVGHLVLVEALLGSSVQRGLLGDSGPPPEAGTDLPAWRQVRAKETQRLSQLAPTELLATFSASVETMRLALGEATTADAVELHGWHPSGVQPLPWFAGQWLFEVALHDWDVRVAADPAAEIHSSAVSGLGDLTRERMRRCFAPRPGDDLTGVVRIELEGPERTAWLARLTSGSLEVLDDGAIEPDATIRSDPSAYVLVQTGRRPAGLFHEAGRWDVGGDMMLAERLTAGFKGF